MTFFDQYNAMTDFAQYNAQFVQQASLQQQQASENAESKVCEWTGEFGVPCNANFATADQLAQHVLFAHVNNTTTNPKYHCFWSDCTRSNTAFKAKYKLVNHLRVHTGEKPFVCKVPGCGKAFGRTENLKIHSRVHTGEKPFKCQFEGCEKTFSNSSDRKKHASVHMNGVFECPLPGCERTYCHASSMRKHMKTHGKSAIGLKMPSRTVSSNLYDSPMRKPTSETSPSTPPVIKSEPVLLEKLESSIGSLHQSSGTESSGSEGSQSPQPTAIIPTNESDITAVSNELYDPNAYYNAYYSNLTTMQHIYGTNMTNYPYPMESMNQMMWPSYAANYENGQSTYNESDSFHLHN